MQYQYITMDDLRRLSGLVTEESRPEARTLGDLCTIKTNFPDADFWIVRRGSVETVGSPSREFNPQHIGVKVTATDRLDQGYLYYWFQFIHSRGVFRQLANGTLKLVNIKTTDVSRLPISFR